MLSFLGKNLLLIVFGLRLEDKNPKQNKQEDDSAKSKDYFENLKNFDLIAHFLLNHAIYLALDHRKDQIFQIFLWVGNFPKRVGKRFRKIF
jgi:hypothetical protein